MEAIRQRELMKNFQVKRIFVGIFLNDGKGTITRDGQVNFHLCIPNNNRVPDYKLLTHIGKSRKIFPKSGA